MRPRGRSHVPCSETPRWVGAMTDFVKVMLGLVVVYLIVSTVAGFGIGPLANRVLFGTATQGQYNHGVRGGGTPSDTITRARASQVKKGMHKREVIALLGRPYRETSVGPRDYLRYQEPGGHAAYKWVFVFRKDRLVEKWRT